MGSDAHLPGKFIRREAGRLASPRRRAHYPARPAKGMSTPHLPPPPRLATLHTRPSWHNRAGRVDRSACFVLRAAELWRRIPDHHWHVTLRDQHPHARPRPPATNPPHRFGKPDRTADLTLHARDLWLLHRHQPPYPLQGDLRSAKSNALRAQTAHKKDTHTPHHTRDDPVLGKGPVNPNRGVGFNQHKMLGLDCLWHTTLRLQRIVQHAHLKQHFLLCPVCQSRTGIPACHHSSRTGIPACHDSSRTAIAACHDSSRTAIAACHDSSGADIPVCRSAQPNQPPLGGTSPPANKQTKRPPKRLPKLPTGRCTKLYLPLCTPQEYDDAQTAGLWLRTHTRPNRPLTKEAAQLIERYGELFAASGGRTLRCRHCLGLRYGEVKPAKEDRHSCPSNRDATRQRPTQQCLSRTRSRNRNRGEPNDDVRLRGRERGRSPRLTEQALFLQNLPKLLATPGSVPPAPAGAPAARSPGHAIDHSSRPATDRPTPTHGNPTRSPEAQDQLLLTLASTRPAFKALAKAKQQVRRASARQRGNTAPPPR